MAFDISQQVKIVNPVANVDYYYGTYTSIEEACSSVPSEIRVKGKTVGILTDKGVVEYWWKNGITDEDLVLKNISDIDPITQDEISITYAELKYLRDSGGLSVGSWYRITDYETTVFNNANARSAGHPFDILVLATDSNLLSEDAKAVHSARDTEGYFAHANLGAWKLKYSLDNDTTKFAWASDAGKGVIWEMEDEYNNLCCYDFKNVLFKRSLIIATKENPSEDECAFYGKYVGQAMEELPALPEGYAIDPNDSKFLYTFSVIAADGTVEDNSMGVDLTSAGMGIIHLCGLNRMRENVNESSFALDLNNNVFVSTCNSADEIMNLIVMGNTFGTLCMGNTFVNATMENTFGNNCYYNSFGNGCNGNSFGNECYRNSFGNSCRYNSFGNGCQYNDILDNVQYITVFEGVQYVSIGSASGTVQYAQVLNGTRGSDSSNKLQINFATGKNYTQIAGKNSAGELKIWVPADMVPAA